MTAQKINTSAREQGLLRFQFISGVFQLFTKTLLATLLVVRSKNPLRRRTGRWVVGNHTGRCYMRLKYAYGFAPGPHLPGLRIASIPTGVPCLELLATPDLDGCPLVPLRHKHYPVTCEKHIHWMGCSRWWRGGPWRMNRGDSCV